MQRMLSSLLLALLPLAFFSCSPQPSDQEEGALNPELQEDPVVFTAEVLDPVILPTGGQGRVPTGLVVEFARAVADTEAVGQEVDEDTVMRIDPPVEGSLSWGSRASLRFVPSTGFVAGTDYRVQLASLKTPSGILTAPPGESWQGAFSTPGFNFLRVSPSSIDHRRKRAELDLIFSAAVDHRSVEQRTTIEIIDRRERRFKINARFHPTSKAGIVHVVLRHPAIEKGSRIAVTVDPGVTTPDGSGKAAGGTHEIPILAGETVEVKSIFAAEGTNGFYLEVVCDDDSVEGTRYYWDQVTGSSFGRLSRRCLPTEAMAREMIEIRPELPFSISPSGGGFRIFGAFDRGHYSVRVKTGLKTLDGGALLGDSEAEISIPARSPKVNFVGQGRYLPRQAWKSLPIRHLNVDQVHLAVRHVPPENLVFWMTGDNEDAGERTSNLLSSQKFPLKGPSDQWSTSLLDVGTVVSEETRGLLEITLASGGSSATARVVLTDLHLVVKRSKKGEGPWDQDYLIWALDADTLEPQKGVDIELIKASGSGLDRCVTDRKGRCELSSPPQPIDPSAPMALLAKRGDELTYLELEDLEVEVQEASISGDPYGGEREYHAALYSDRGVYRPGETAHVVTLIRDREHGAPLTDMPVTLKINDARGQTFKERQITLNEAGMHAWDITFPSFATTGRWDARAIVGDDVVGSYSFQVEEFVPERMEVKAKGRHDALHLKDSKEVTVSARYLFGGVPADHKVELSCEMEASTFEPQENAEFSYGVWSEDRPKNAVPLGRIEGQLDSEGVATLTCPAESKTGFAGPARLVARAAVFEAGSGRTSVGRTTIPVHPENYYVGLKSGSTSAKAGDEIPITGAVVDWDGAFENDVSEVTLEVLKLETEYGWFYDPDLGRERYERHRRRVSLGRETVAVAEGRFSWVFQPPSNGEGWLIRATAGSARTDLELEGGDRWWWWYPDENSVDQTPRPDRPTWIALSLPDEARVGKKAEVSFTAPFAGRALLTVETDRVLESQWVEVKQAGPVDWNFKLQDFAPNVYVSAFLVKDPHLESAAAFLPDRAFGVHSLKVAPEDLRHEIEIKVAQEVRSESTLTVDLKLDSKEANTWVTVAAVDEGILSLTRFATPDPLTAILKRRALGVSTFETIGWALMAPAATPSSTTGGGGMEELGRVSPVEPVALWSGPVKVDAKGKARVTFNLPPYRGKLRVMAVSASPQRIGQNEASVVVKDPLIVQATLPRFLVQGDELDLPVFITNLSGSERSVAVSLEAENLAVPGLHGGQNESPVEVLTESTTLELGDGEGQQAVFRLRVLRAVGAVTLKAVATADDLRSERQVKAPLLPAGPKVRRLQKVELEAGSLDLSPYVKGWMPLTEKTRFWVTTNPFGAVFDHLGYLVRYPYGCIEQTVSSTRPLLFVPHLLASVDPELVAEGAIEQRVMHGIDRLLSMQTASGGFSYWPGSTNPVSWGTANATHLLIDAQKLGYAVPEGRIEHALEWMEGQITNVYERGRKAPDNRYRDFAVEPYMHYVLALADRPRKARVEQLLTGWSKVDEPRYREALYMLRASLWMAGDRSWERELRQPDLSPIDPKRARGWSFFSDQRWRGFQLSAMVDLFGRLEGAEPLAQVVARNLKQSESRYYTTQEILWGVTGLGKWLEEGAKEFDPGVLKANGRTVEPVTKGQHSSAERAWNLSRAGEYDRLELAVSQKGEGKLFLLITSEGVPKDGSGIPYGGKGLSLKRRYLTAEGLPLNPAKSRVKLGDLLYVELTLANLRGEKLDNLALVDRLPAALEIENPRLGRSDATPEWIDPETLWEADHMEIRDDRLEVFGGLDNYGTRKVIYAVRVVTAGTFKTPSAEVEAMYDPRLWSRVRGGGLEVKAPWD